MKIDEIKQKTIELKIARLALSDIGELNRVIHIDQFAHIAISSRYSPCQESLEETKKLPAVKARVCVSYGHDGPADYLQMLANEPDRLKRFTAVVTGVYDWMHRNIDELPDFDDCDI